MTLPRAGRVLEAAIAERVFPGAVVEVGRRGGALATMAAGRLTYDADAAPVTGDTVYDLASLTKVIATAPFAMAMLESRRIGLEDPVAVHSETWQGEDRRDVRLRDLLEHASGLPAHRRYYETLQGAEAFEAAIGREPLVYAPRTASVYSDAGFMLLGFILERAARGSIAHGLSIWRAAALGDAVDLTYWPPESCRPRIAPTEHDPWRGRLLIGEVHDENAAALGGAAAHAGAFGTVAAVGAAARWWLALLAGEDRPPAGAATARLFAERSTVPGSSRALAWDTMRPTSSCGTRMSPSAIGHTGFTGTSLWIDPERDLYVAFLSNRVHPTRSGEAMLSIRPALHDAIADDLEISP